MRTLDRGGAALFRRKMEEQLPGPVLGGGDEGGREPLERELGGQLRAQPTREVRHRVERRRVLPVHPGEDLRHAPARLAGRRAPRLELGAGQILDVAGQRRQS
jgi:hypothetical protein